MIVPSKPNIEILLLSKNIFPPWSSPRPISKCQLNTLLCLHLIPIYLILSKGSYRITPWEISS